jgi:hypothetical protein
MIQFHKTLVHLKGILLRYPETRNSYEKMIIKYIDIYCGGDYRQLVHFKIENITRLYRKLQNDLLFCPPSPEVKAMRKRKEKAMLCAIK